MVPVPWHSLLGAAEKSPESASHLGAEAPRFSIHMGYHPRQSLFHLVTCAIGLRAAAMPQLAATVHDQFLVWDVVVRPLPDQLLEDKQIARWP